MKRITTALTGAAVAGLATLFAATPAQATEPIPVVSDCLQGWYVNPDEGDRLPESTEDGLVFEPADLVHHQTDILLKDLEPGSYVADPAPDQPSFFSVEVRDDRDNYGTLRWNGTVWSITIGPGGSATNGTFTDADPVLLLTAKRSKWGSDVFNTDATHVVSFGVGYTQTPPGTVLTTVTEVTFAGQTYDLTCQPAPETSAPGGGLADTGTDLTWILGAAVALILVGAASVLVARRRAHE